MKKSIIFIILVTFVVSIFILSSFGTSSDTSQLKHYFQSVEIINVEVIDIGTKKIKYVEVDFDEEFGETYYYIDYVINPDSTEVTEQDAFEFVITSDVPTFDYDDGHEIIQKPCATIYKNVVTFYAECSVSVTLQTTDGSRLSDSVTIICSIPATE